MAEDPFVVRNGLIVNTSLIWANNGQVGINTTSPTANLHVQGNVFISNTATIVGAVSLANTLTVTGNVTVSNTLNVTGGVTLGSLVLGTPTGGNEGAGTLNVQGGLYVNGVLQYSGFPSGTTTIFQQNTAPTGWTKVLTFNDVGIRVVNGNVNTVTGATAFSTVFSQTSTGNTVLTTAQIPSHLHSLTDPTHQHGSNPAGYYFALTDGTYVNLQAGSDYAEYLADNLGSTTAAASTGITVNNTGGGGGHNHTISLNLNYIDFILATKN
jgi:hypothetical protein